MIDQLMMKRTRTNDQNNGDLLPRRTRQEAGGEEHRPPMPDMHPPTSRFPPFNGGEAGQMRRRRSAYREARHRDIPDYYK